MVFTIYCKYFYEIYLLALFYSLERGGGRGLQSLKMWYFMNITGFTLLRTLKLGLSLLMWIVYDQYQCSSGYRDSSTYLGQEMFVFSHAWGDLECTLQSCNPATLFGRPFRCPAKMTKVFIEKWCKSLHCRRVTISEYIQRKDLKSIK